MVACVSTAAAPAVFDLPAVGLAGFLVNVHTGEAHCVVHLAYVVVQHIFLGHADIQTGDGSFIVLFDVPARLGAVVVLAAVGAEPYDFVILDLVDNHLLEVVHGYVQVAYSAAADHVAEELDGVGLAERLVFGGRVDDGNIVVQIIADVLFKEGEGSQTLFHDDLLVLVLVFKVEFGQRNIVAGTEEGVNLFQHLGAECIQSLSVAFVRVLAEEGSLCAQVQVDVLVQVAGAGGLSGFGIANLRENTVLLHDIHEHIPLTAVVYTGGNDIVNQTGVVRFSCGVNDGFYVVVDSLELIPEREVGLGQLEVFHVQLLRDDFAEHIGSRKEPAASASLLVGGAHGLDVMIEEELHGLRLLGHECHVVHACFRENGGHSLTNGVRFMISRVFREICGGNGVFHIDIPFLGNNVVCFM